nr:retrovirus-related Pol polyprotein from transposon TNT 1-94 [Tanacetum cinerariifolium]
MLWLLWGIETKPASASSVIRDTTRNDIMIHSHPSISNKNRSTCNISLQPFEGDDKFPKDTTEEVKKKIMAKAHFVILLSVTDEVLREEDPSQWSLPRLELLMAVLVLSCSKHQQRHLLSRGGNESRNHNHRATPTIGVASCSVPSDRECVKKGNSKGEYSNSGSAAVVQDGSDDGDFGDVLTVCSASTVDSWIMDTGASHHMMFSRDLFTSFNEWNGTVKLGDDAVLFIKGYGIVQIKIHDGIVRKFDCWFVPGLKKNLISLGTLAKNGLKYHGEGFICVEQAGFTWWDVTGKIQFCEACVKGKQYRVKFSTCQHTSKEILKYVHSDLWGPSPVKSQGGCVYFVTFIDDYSRKVWVYFLKTKDEVFGKFKEWKTKVEKWTVNIASYLVNRSPSTAISLKTPQEVWSSKPSDYSDLRIFGCPAYAHVNDEGKSHDKFLISRDVTFDESAMLGQSRGCKSFTDTKDYGADQKSEPQVEAVEEEADNTGTKVEDSDIC